MESESYSQDNGGTRHDEGKPPLHLIPWDAILELASVYAKGAEEYSPRNWERGMNWSKPYNSMLRHAIAFWRREDRDPKTQLRHAAQMVWNAMALLTYQLRECGVDDRPKIEEKGVNTSEGNPTICLFCKKRDGTHTQDCFADNISETLMQTTGPIHTAVELKKGVRFKAIAGISPSEWVITKMLPGGEKFIACGSIEGDSKMFSQMMTIRSIGHIIFPQKSNLRCYNCPNDALHGSSLCNVCLSDASGNK